MSQLLFFIIRASGGSSHQWLNRLYKQEETRAISPIFKNKTIMKPHFLFPHWCRYLGWGLVIAHVPMSIIGRANGMINPLDNPPTQSLFTGEHLFFICTSLVMALGLFIVAFSREKVEDEQIWHLRLDSLRCGPSINYLVLIASLIFYIFDGAFHECFSCLLPVPMVKLNVIKKSAAPKDFFRCGENA